MLIFHYTFVEASCDDVSEMTSCLTSCEVTMESRPYFNPGLKVRKKIKSGGDTEAPRALQKILSGAPLNKVHASSK